MSSRDFPLPKGTDTVVLGLGDLNGIMRGKRIPVENWSRVCADGNAFSLAFFTVDMTCDVWDTPYASFSNGYPDFHIFPLSVPVSIPWESGVAFCFGRAETMDHTPVPIDPRVVLERQVNRASAMGIDVKVGTELEFYLLDPATNLPRDKGIEVYGLDRAAEMESILGPIRRHLTAMGIPIEQSNPEYAAGQVEVNIRYDEALRAADRVVMFRSLIRQLSAHHGYKATFMAKPFFSESGNGFHCHYSLWRGNKNIFSDGGKLSDTARYFIGGLQKRMCESSLCGSFTVNGYRRRVSGSFCPVNVSWGYDNRTTALRVIEGSESSCRVEKRDAGADCNPYLLLASDIAAGLDGIESSIEPSSPTLGNAYAESDSPPLPTDLSTAISLARNSVWLRDLLGDFLHDLVCQQSERELDFFARQVTAVELDRYLDSF